MDAVGSNDDERMLWVKTIMYGYCGLKL